MNGAESYFHKYGIVSLLIGRFIGPLRPMLPMVAGMCDMPIPRFIGVSLLAGMGWAVAYLLPGWATGAAIRLPLPEGFWPQAAMVAVGLAALLGLSINASIRRQSGATVLIGALSLSLLLAVFVGYPYLSALDRGISALPHPVLGCRRGLRHFAVNPPMARPVLFRWSHAVYRSGQHHDQTLLCTDAP